MLVLDGSNIVVKFFTQRRISIFFFFFLEEESVSYRAHGMPPLCSTGSSVTDNGYIIIIYSLANVPLQMIVHRANCQYKPYDRKDDPHVQCYCDE